MVDAYYEHDTNPIEDYIDMNPILEDLYINHFRLPYLPDISDFKNDFKTAEELISLRMKGAKQIENIFRQLLLQ